MTLSTCFLLQPLLRKSWECKSLQTKGRRRTNEGLCYDNGLLQSFSYKKTNLEEDLEYLLPVKLGEILCRRCWGKAQNVSLRTKEWRKIDRWRTLRYEYYSFTWVFWLQKKTKTKTKKIEEFEYLLPVRFGEIPCGGCWGKVENVGWRRTTERQGICATKMDHFDILFTSETKLVRGPGVHVFYNVHQITSSNY